MSEQKKLHNPYTILGVEQTATQDEIKKAYRRKAQELHPDKNPDNPQAAAEFNLVQKAYELLGDEVRRAEFDKNGRIKPSDSEYDQMASDALNTNLHAVCDRIADNGGDQARGWGTGVQIPNPLMLMRTEFNTEVAMRRKAIKQTNAKIKALNRVVKRFSHKEGFEHTPLFRMLSTSIEELNRSVFDAEVAIEVFNRMTKLLENFEYTSAFYDENDNVVNTDEEGEGDNLPPSLLGFHIR